jgi:hypothetical protein
MWHCSWLEHLHPQDPSQAISRALQLQLVDWEESFFWLSLKWELNNWRIWGDLSRCFVLRWNRGVGVSITWARNHFLHIQNSEWKKKMQSWIGFVHILVDRTTHSSSHPLLSALSVLLSEYFSLSGTHYSHSHPSISLHHRASPPLL